MNGIPAKIKALKKETRIKAIEIHAHDDFGNAVENTMAAIRAAYGVWDKIYVSTTYLGIGERAGNAETEKVLLNLHALWRHEVRGQNPTHEKDSRLHRQSHRLRGSAQQSHRRRLRLCT